MRKLDLERLLEKTVADALGLSLPPVANTIRPAHGKPRRTFAPRHVAKTPAPVRAQHRSSVSA